MCPGESGPTRMPCPCGHLADRPTESIPAVSHLQLECALAYNKDKVPWGRGADPWTLFLATLPLGCFVLGAVAIYMGLGSKHDYHSDYTTLNKSWLPCAILQIAKSS